MGKKIVQTMRSALVVLPYSCFTQAKGSGIMRFKTAEKIDDSFIFGYPPGRPA